MKDLRGRDLLRLRGVVTGYPLIGPRSVNIHLTNVCNLACRFCWYHSPLVTFDEKKKELDIAVFKRVIDDCAAMSVDAVDLEGGEVVCYSQAEEAFRYVSRSGVALHAYTNLAYGRKPLAYVALANRLNVNFSAVNRESYRQMHGADHFDQVVENIRILTSLHIKKKKPRIWLTFIINENNFRDIELFLALADSLGVERVFFRLFEATVEMKSLVFSGASARILGPLLIRLLGCAYKTPNNLEEISAVVNNGQFLENIADIPRTTHNNDRFFYYHNLRSPTTRCYTGWFFSLIDEKGRVIAPCDNIGVCIAGNVYKHSFRDIWFSSEKFRRIRQEALHCIDTRKRKWKECRYCGHAVFNQEMDDFIAQRKVSP